MPSLPSLEFVEKAISLRKCVLHLRLTCVHGEGKSKRSVGPTSFSLMAELLFKHYNYIIQTSFLTHFGELEIVELQFISIKRN